MDNNHKLTAYILKHPPGDEGWDIKDKKKSDATEEISGKKSKKSKKDKKSKKEKKNEVVEEAVDDEFKEMLDTYSKDL